MKKVLIDFKGVKYYSELYDVIKKSFWAAGMNEYPDFCGENVDALWDVLTGFIGRPVDITFVNTDKTSRELGFVVKKVVRVFFLAAENEYWEIFVKVLDSEGNEIDKSEFS